MSYVINHLHEIVSALNRAGLETTNEGFGRNAMASTPYTQYTIYLAQRHLDEDRNYIADVIAAACPQFVVDGFLDASYQIAHGRFAAELWCFVHLKSDDKNYE